MLAEAGPRGSTLDTVIAKFPAEMLADLVACMRQGETVRVDERTVEIIR